MIARRSILVTVALAGLAAVAPLGAQQVAAQQDSMRKAGQDQPPAPTPVMLKASELIGAMLVDVDGKDVGRIADIAVDVQDGRVQFVAVPVGLYVNPLDANGARRLTGIPMELLRREHDKLVLTRATRAQVATAPMFTPEEWPDLDNRGWVADIWRHFDRVPYWKDVVPVPPPPPSQREGSEPVTQPERTAPPAEAAPPWSFSRTSGVLHTFVRNRTGDELGKADELVFDLGQARVAYAVVTPTAALGLDGKLIAVPWGGMLHGGERMVVDADKSRFAEFPAFSAAEWPDFADAGWRRQLDEAFPRPPLGGTER